jgi:uncharacterized protein YuzE
MQIRLDADVNALYIRVRQGQIVRTLELTDSIYVDLDEHDAPLGTEFVDADEFIPFLRDHAADENIPNSGARTLSGSCRLTEEETERIVPPRS